MEINFDTENCPCLHKTKVACTCSEYCPTNCEDNDSHFPDTDEEDDSAEDVP